MPGVSIHVVDVSRGVVGAGMKLQLSHQASIVADGVATPKGLLEVNQRLSPGVYEALFYVGDWYRAQGVPLPAVPFLDVVTYRFGIADPEQHYHLPFKFTPWGYSCFRGGA